MGPCRRFALLIALVAGCGDDVMVIDAGGPDGGTDAGAGPAAPDIPWLGDGSPPLDWDCAPGWREIAERGTTTCEPFPLDGPEACGDGEAHLVGESGCAPIGDPCPTGDFPPIAPGAPRVIYVDAAAPAGGDGSETSPLSRLSDVGWASLASGTVVALAAGRYDGTLPLRAGVEVVGACAQASLLTGVAAPVASVVSVTSAGDPAVLRNVSIVDAPQRGARVEAGRRMELDGVIIARATSAGIVARGAGAEVTLRDVVVEETRSETDGRFGVGASVEEGALLTASRATFSSNHSAGILLYGVGSVGELTDVAVKGTLPRGDGMNGRGVVVEDGARLSLTRALVAGNHETGIYVRGPAAVVSLEDVVIRDTEARQSDLALGTGIYMELGARLDGRRLRVVRNRHAGITVTDPASVLVLSDALVAETLPRAMEDALGHGVVVFDGASFEARGLVVADNTELSVFASGAGAHVVLEDAVVRGTRPSIRDMDVGDGLAFVDGSRLDATRLLVADHREGGLIVGNEGTEVVLTDTVIRNILPRASDGGGGYGLMVADQARISGTRVAISDVSAMGIVALAYGNGRFEDIAISRIDSPCSGDDCLYRPGGYGVATTAVLRLTRFLIDDAALCGVLVAAGDGPTELDLIDGVIRGSPIGACVQVPGYALERLTDAVSYEDNATNLDATSLPVPPALGIFGDL